MADKTSPTTTTPKGPSTTTGSGSSAADAALQQLQGPGGFQTNGIPRPTPKQYLGVASPRWEQNGDGTWSEVPGSGYSRVIGTPDMGIVATPGYYEGDEYSLISGMGASPEAVAAIQARLAEARLMPKEYRIGTWDGDSVDAFKYVLTYANQTTQDWQHALDDLIKGAGSLPPLAGPKGPTFTAHLSNPDDIKKAFKDVTYNLLGGQFADPGQADAFVQTFQAQELGAQRAAFNAATGGGGTVTDAPNLGTAAETQLQTTDQAGLQAKKYNDFANVLGNILTQRSPQTNAT